jgi:hypothetical protein
MQSIKFSFGMMTRKALGAICLFVLSGILVAGLWPFHAPKNEVSWLSSGNGLLFGEYGSIVSEGAFKANESQKAAPCSLEIWLQPSREYSGTILAFYWPEHRVVPFKLWQSHDYLGIQHTRLNQFDHPERSKIYVADLFRQGKSVFLTISSGPTGTTVYADGVLTRKDSNFRFSSQDLSGRFVIGNGPTTTSTWSGELKGLAIYDHELTAGEVSQHYADWTTNTRTDLAKSENVAALYLFNEGKGSVTRNRIDSRTDFVIPKRFFVLHERFLEPPWSEFHPTWGYWKDIGINIAGFVPFGFFFCWWFSFAGKTKRAVVVTIVLGFAVSLAIEVLQGFLPTRNSGVTDLITNTSGTALGSMMWFYFVAGKELEQPRDRIQQHFLVTDIEIGSGKKVSRDHR